jgi:hypothetical protein
VRTDRRTDRHEDASAFRNFANAPENIIYKFKATHKNLILLMKAEEN